MTVRTTDFGGTDWSDGEVGYAADLNDTFEAVKTHITTEDTTLDNKIDSEVTTLDNKIDSEISTRSTNDTTLQTNIDLKLTPLSNMDTTDNTVQSDSRATASGVGTNSYVTKRTLVVGANVVKNYIVVIFDLEAFTYVNAAGIGGNDGKSHAQITIDSVQKFTTFIYSYSFSDANSARQQCRTRTATFKYTPTSSEKTNGFTVDLDIATQILGFEQSGTQYCYNYSWAIFKG